jgi:hypothetical protein
MRHEARIEVWCWHGLGWVDLSRDLLCFSSLPVLSSQEILRKDLVWKDDVVMSSLQMRRRALTPMLQEWEIEVNEQDAARQSFQPEVRMGQIR